MLGKMALALVVLVAGAVGVSGSRSVAAIQISHHSAALSFGASRQTLSFQLVEPAGVIWLYRISVPRGVRVHGFAQLRGVTVPLRIATTPAGGCAEAGSRVICTVGEEGCPMPAGTWHFRFTKLGGPAGTVDVRFEVGTLKR